jgi:hypothetical protein
VDDSTSIVGISDIHPRTLSDILDLGERLVHRSRVSPQSRAAPLLPTRAGEFRGME